MQDQQYYKDLDKRIEMLYLQSIEDRKRAEEDRKKAEKMYEQSVEDRKRAEEDRKKAEEDRKKAEEDRKKAEEANKRLDKLTARQDREYEKVKESVGLRGKFAEEVAYRGVVELFGKRQVDIHRVIKNAHGKKTKREYDLIAVNDTSIIVIEVKTQVKVDDVLYMVQSQLPSFKQEFPEYRDYTIYGGIAGMIYPDNIQKMSYREGLYVMRLSDTYMEIVNSKNFVPKVFG